MSASRIRPGNDEKPPPPSRRRASVRSRSGERVLRGRVGGGGLAPDNFARLLRLGRLHGDLRLGGLFGGAPDQ